MPSTVDAAIGKIDVPWTLLTISTTANVCILLTVLIGKYGRYTYRKY
jgi:hypothetical protein